MMTGVPVHIRAIRDEAQDTTSENNESKCEIKDKCHVSICICLFVGSSTSPPVIPPYIIIIWQNSHNELGEE